MKKANDVESTKKALKKKIDELPTADVFVLLENTANLLPCTLTFHKIPADLQHFITRKPVNSELAKKIENVGDNEKLLEPLLREYVELWFNYQCEWLDFLHRKTTDTPDLTLYFT